MELITRQDKANETAAGWERNYKGDRDGCAARIRALGLNPDPDKVDAIIGNGSWTRCTCWECMRDVDAVVRVGQEPDYDSVTCWLCRDCAEKVVAAFNSQKPQDQMT